MSFFTPSRLIVFFTALALIVGLSSYLFMRSDMTPSQIAARVTDGFGDERDKDIPYEKVVNKIVPHKALYRLSLVKIHAGSPITELGGEMYFKWEDTCEAWSTDHRFRIDYYYIDRPSVSVTSHFVSWEEKSGNRIHFLTEGYTDGVMDENQRGEAVRTANNGARVQYSQPIGVNFDLQEGIFFPTQHTVATIYHALRGENFFNAVMFDGTDDSGPSEINAFISQDSRTQKIPEYLQDREDIDSDLLQGKSWTTQMAFFSLDSENAKESLPSYEMTVRLHENGIVSDIIVDYDKFSVRQELVALAPLPRPECGDEEDS